MSAFPRGKREQPVTSDPDSSVVGKRSATQSDFLFKAEASEGVSPARSKRRRSEDQGGLGQGIRGMLGGGNITYPSSQKAPPTIDGLGLPKLNKGCKVLGIVLSVISPDLALVSIQNCITGYVMRKDQSEPSMSDVLKPNTVMSFAIVATNKDEKRVELSFKPALVNRGMTSDQICTGCSLRTEIKSKEDHGYIINTGIGGTAGFLPFKLVTDKSIPSKSLVPGQCLDLIVHSSPSERSFTFSLPPPSPKTFAPSPNHVSPTCSPHTLKSLVPNMLVRCSIEGYARNGVFVSFLTHFHASIDQNHLSQLYPTDEWKDALKSGSSTLVARIIVVDSASKTIRLSMLPHILAQTAPSDFPAIGTTISDIPVLRVDSKIGALLKSSKPVFVHASEVSDETSKANKLDDLTLHKTFKPAETFHAVRVTGSYLFEGWVKATARPSRLSAAVLSYNDLEPGKLYQGVEILTVADYGILVSLGSGIRGVVSNMHLSDVAIKNKAQLKHLKTGNKIDVRVLTVDAEGRKCACTCKKSLLAHDDTRITSWEGVQPNQIATGFVTKVNQDGVIVTFYNNVHGTVSAKSLAEDLGVEDPTENYKAGQIVRARVVSRKKYRLVLSMDITKTTELEPADISVTKFGAVLDSKDFKVTKMVKDDVFPHALATYIPTSTTCKLPFESLQDSYSGKTEKADIIKAGLSSLKVGKHLPGKKVLVLTTDKKYPHAPILSLRLSMITCASGDGFANDESAVVPYSASQLAIGTTAVGYVVNKDKKNGAFIRFLNGLTGLVPTLKGADEIELYSTVGLVVSGLDTKSKPAKILLTKKSKSKSSGSSNSLPKASLNVGDTVGKVEIIDIKFGRANVKLLDYRYDGGRAKTRIHFSLMKPSTSTKSSKKSIEDSDGVEITSSHPFHSLKVGSIIDGLRVASKDEDPDREGVVYVDLTNLDDVQMETSELEVGSTVSGAVQSIIEGRGLMVVISPEIRGWVPVNELTEDISVLSDLKSHYPTGSRIETKVTKLKADKLELSVIKLTDGSGKGKRVLPKKGSIVAGKINRRKEAVNGPALTIDLRDGYTGRVDITELDDEDDWENLPLGRWKKEGDQEKPEIIFDAST